MSAPEGDHTNVVMCIWLLELMSLHLQASQTGVNNHLADHGFLWFCPAVGAQLHEAT